MATHFYAASAQAGPHNITIVENDNGTYGWECSCGDEADEFEDYDAADSNADEHRRHAP